MTLLEIQHLEKLARLSLTESERKEMHTDLQNILTMVKKLDELDLSDTEPLVYLSENPAPMRSDTAQPHLDRKTVLQNAPMAEEAYFKVPKVIEK
jgi:aspartyl-tRNA(Asn)/glutamyl-tRNA(Gln) amidotransferase subunit C